MQIKTVKDLKVYNLSYKLAMEIFQTTKKFPKEEIYSLTDQVRRKKEIRTTGNQPLWGRTADKNYSNSITESSSMRNVLPVIFWIDRVVKKILMAFLNFSKLGGWMRKISIPGYSIGGKFNVTEKSLSLVRRILFSFFSRSATTSSGVRAATCSTSCPADLRKFITSSRKFSSARKRMNLRDFNHMSGLRHPGSVLQRGFDMLHGQLRVGILDDFLRCLSTGEHLQNQIHHDPGSFETRFAVADGRIGDYVFIDFDSHAKSITAIAGDVNLKYNHNGKGR